MHIPLVARLALRCTVRGEDARASGSGWSDPATVAAGHGDSLCGSAEVGSGRPPDLQGRETQRKSQAIARASAVCHRALVPCVVPHRGQPSLQGGAVGRESVEPSRLVDSLCELAQLSLVRPLADSLSESVQGGRCRAQTPAGGRAASLSDAVPSRDMSQPPGKPGRHAPVRGQHEACRHSSASVAV